MRMRPAHAKWFELLVPHDEFTDTLEALAHTGCVELEMHTQAHEKLDLQDLQLRLQEFRRLQRYYHRWWPEPDTAFSPFAGTIIDILDSALAALSAWETDARPKLHKLERISSRISELKLLRHFLSSPDTNQLDYRLLSSTGSLVAARLYLLPTRQTRLDHIPASVYRRIYAVSDSVYLLLTGTRDDLDRLNTELTVKKCTAIATPSLPEERHEALEKIDRTCKQLSALEQRLQEELRVVAREMHLSHALGEIQHQEWLLEHISTLPVSDNFAWITGWTTDSSGDRLRTALELQGSHAIVHFPAAPEGRLAPLILQNPWWAKPFEIFSALLGMPERHEIDPSQILAVMVPVLFGYMFADVGQGLVLLFAGILLHKRWPLLRLLIPNGASAMLFGLVFGSVFGREDLIAPLWLHPIEHPLPVLAIPLVAGTLIILTGLVLSGIEAFWRRDRSHWLQVEAPITAMYMAIVLSVALPSAASLALLLSSVIWFVAGHLLERGIRVTSFVSALGHLLESVLQLILNTLSFIRVGAFALAHAGLSLAFNIMADGMTSAVASLLILVLGNLVVILLEGLVVSIQTTRLVLFEFFIRFLQAQGRSFKPLPTPSAHAQQQLNQAP